MPKANPYVTANRIGVAAIAAGVLLTLYPWDWGVLAPLLVINGFALVAAGLMSTDSRNLFHVMGFFMCVAAVAAFPAFVLAGVDLLTGLRAYLSLTAVFAVGLVLVIIGEFREHGLRPRYREEYMEVED